MGYKIKVMGDRYFRYYLDSDLVLTLDIDRAYVYTDKVEAEDTARLIGGTVICID